MQKWLNVFVYVWGCVCLIPSYPDVTSLMARDCMLMLSQTLHPLMHREWSLSLGEDQEAGVMITTKWVWLFLLYC